MVADYDVIIITIILLIFAGISYWTMMRFRKMNPKQAYKKGKENIEKMRPIDRILLFLFPRRWNKKYGYSYYYPERTYFLPYKIGGLILAFILMFAIYYLFIGKLALGVSLLIIFIVPLIYVIIKYKTSKNN